MVVVVDFGQIVELGAAQTLDRREEAPVARLTAEALEAALERGPVVRDDRPELEVVLVQLRGLTARYCDGPDTTV